ncbi:UNVERIFIED_CONTAM: hypothetical protein Sradi_1546800 [Sesamum radiatum]|uniref:Uncharacterized protein n=1 Tax=Sesamum radiatum TaxID=300843 RepID=A0AAW2U7Z7_SESRA
MDGTSTNTENEFTVQAMQQQFTRIRAILEGITDRLERLEQPTPRRRNNHQIRQSGPKRRKKWSLHIGGNRGGRRRQGNEVNRDLKSIKLKFPHSKEEVIQKHIWSEKKRRILYLSVITEEKKVKLTAIEFTDYAIVWWDQLITN